jgi:hypothetical protein
MAAVTSALLEGPCARAEADILQDLGHRFEEVRGLAGAPAGFGEYGKDLQGCDQTVAGRGKIAEHHVARLLAAHVVAMLAHVLDHIAVTDGRAHELQLHAVEITLEPEVRHHGGHDAAAAQQA